MYIAATEQVDHVNYSFKCLTGPFHYWLILQLQKSALHDHIKVRAHRRFELFNKKINFQWHVSDENYFSM